MKKNNIRGNKLQGTTKVRLRLHLLATILTVFLSYGACSIANQPLGTDATVSSSSKTQGRFVTFRRGNNPGFEGIYLRVIGTPTRPPDTIYRDLANLEDPLAKLCQNPCGPVSKGQAQTVSWSVRPFGPTIGDFIFVPSKDLDSLTDQGLIEAAQGFVKQRSRQLQVDGSGGNPNIKAVDTDKARALFNQIISDPKQFRKLTVAGRNIDSSDPEWALALTNTHAAHKSFFIDKGKKPGAGTRIAVIDTGLTDHPELKGVNLVYPAGSREGVFLMPKDQQDLIQSLKQQNWGPVSDFAAWLSGFATNENSLRFWGPLLNPNHGTSSLSLVASPPNRTKPSDRLGWSVTGTAYGAEILVAKISNSVVLVSGKAAAAAIRWAVDKGADVISMSMGGVSTDELFQATEYARSNGVILVAAAGTGTGSFTVYPASYRSVVGVTSVDEGCRADDQTAYSPFIDVAGPGKNAWLALSLKHPKNNTEIYAVRPSFGTSLSTPHVAGIASLWIAHHGRKNLERRFGRENIPWLFKFILQNRQNSQKSAVHNCDGRFQRDNPGISDRLGSGVIDAHALLSLDLSQITRRMIEDYASNQSPNGMRPPGAGLGTQIQQHSQGVARAIGERVRAFVE